MSNKITSAHVATGVRKVQPKLSVEEDKFLIALENMVSNDEDPFPGGTTIEFPEDEPTLESTPIEKPKKKKKSKTTE